MWFYFSNAFWEPSITGSHVGKHWPWKPQPDVSIGRGRATATVPSGIARGAGDWRLRTLNALMCCRNFYFSKESTNKKLNETSTVVRSPPKKGDENYWCVRNFNSKWHYCASYWMVNISSALVQMLLITWDIVSWTLLLREWKLRYLIMMIYRKCRLCWNLKWIGHFIMKG